MRILISIISFGAITCTSPVMAYDLEHQTPFRAKPKPVAAMTIANKRVEMLAVTRKARADTMFRRAHLDESRDMSKVIPGYPQPAFVSVDIKINF